MLKCLVSTALLMALSGAVLAVNITFDPVDYGYTSNGSYGLFRPAGQGDLWGVSGPQTFNATTGASDWYTLYIQPGQVGQFRVVDAGGGVYNLVTRNSNSDAGVPAGLSSTGFGTTGPFAVKFATQPVTVTRPANYAGSWEVNWSGSSRRYDASSTLRLPPMYAGQNYEMFVANLPVDLKFNLAGSGAVTITDQQANLSGTWTSLPALGATGGMQSVALPTLLYKATVTVIGNPRGTNNPNWSWWSLDSEVASYNLQATSGMATIWCYPGDATLYGDLGAGSWKFGDSTLNVPINPYDPIYGAGFKETLVRLSTEPGAPSEVYYMFAFPEPTSLVLLALGGVAVSRRRR